MTRHMSHEHATPFCFCPLLPCSLTTSPPLSLPALLRNVPALFAFGYNPMLTSGKQFLSSKTSTKEVLRRRLIAAMSLVSKDSCEMRHKAMFYKVSTQLLH